MCVQKCSDTMSQSTQYKWNKVNECYREEKTHTRGDINTGTTVTIPIN